MDADRSMPSVSLGDPATDHPEDGVRLAPAPSVKAASAAGSPLRPHYTPQFSATTEMILKRIRGEPNNLSSAISSASAAGVIQQSTYEDAKRRLVMSMNTSLALPISAPAAAPANVPPPVPKKELQSPRTVSTPKRGRPREADKKGKTPKRRRVKNGEGDASPALSEPSQSEDEYQDAAAPTTTKSGRHILKPAQFTPTTAAASAKRKHYGKRTSEQALCKVCTRGLSPISNQIVFCDGCNSCWHQLCHEPYIDDELLNDESRSWFCRGCQAKKEKHLAKKKSIEGFKGASWANKSADQKRAYLASLSQSQLVNIVMYSLELHPDLPIFPAAEGSGAKRGARAASTATLSDNFALLPTASSPAQFSKSIVAENGHQKSGKNDPSTPDQISTMGQAGREASVESIPPAWPKIGRGVLVGLKMNEDDFQDKNDLKSFSVATYDAMGKKVGGNAMPALRQ
ncbi:hypothetical protein BX600DRAFT_105130 [Xylariales sp. PMI_506]|nr:hypothetical protein BX600DRAFT_105130 [Xylariales sp. PMI_506]